MKPLWNAPSLGTFRAGEARVVIFLIVVFQPLVLVPLFVLAPLRTSLAAAWRKEPRHVWRCAVTMSMITALLLTIPISPLCVGANWPFPVTAKTVEEEFVSSLGFFTYLNIALTIELALLPVVIASAVHTAWFSRKPQLPKVADKPDAPA
ncbi:MAG: hypothetical protein QM775_02025 [Pirellulales bacterium]